MGAASARARPVNLDYNRAVQADLRSALSYFDREGGSKLGDRFFAEVEATLARIAAHPARFGFLCGDLRRRVSAPSRITSSIESRAAACAFSCCGTIGDGQDSAWDALEPVNGFGSREAGIHSVLIPTASHALSPSTHPPPRAMLPFPDDLGHRPDM